MTPRIGSLFSGYSGLEMAVRDVLGGQVAWHVELDEAASKVLAHRYPGVPNLGDITRVDWSQVEPVDILAGGFPCTDVSAAGARAGMHPGTKSGLWAHFAYAIAVLRPRRVVIENVRGLLTSRGAAPTEELLAAWAERDKCDRVLALIRSKLAKARRDGAGFHVRQHTVDRDRFVVRRRRAMVSVRRADARIVRAIGAVLGSLADLGYDASWCGLRAADVGAPHGRYRIFITAWPTAGDSEVLGRDAARTALGRGGSARPAGGPGVSAADTSGAGRRLAGRIAPGPPQGVVRQEGRPVGRGGGAFAPDSHCDAVREQPVAFTGRRSETVAGLAGADLAADADEQGPQGRGLGGPAGQAPVGDGPGPSVARGVAPNASGDRRGEGRAGSTGVVGGPDAAVGGDEAAPDPDLNEQPRERIQQPRGPVAAGCGGGSAADSDRSGLGPAISDIRAGEPDADWRAYTSAVRRWEALLGRPAPAPTILGSRGQPKLSPFFVEWMQGLPAGHVTAVPGISTNDMLRILGNGVVPQQGAAALSWLLSRAGEVAA